VGGVAVIEWQTTPEMLEGAIESIVAAEIRLGEKEGSWGRATARILRHLGLGKYVDRPLAYQGCRVEIRMWCDEETLD
jgi:hypothetical protein